ncbi:MAG: Asr1405/Asl0597 family protein [Cyanobacteria bacterium P01_A01_bin.17]
MNSENQISQLGTAIEINCQNRWAIYRRLQELDIPCDCGAYQPLTVQVDNPEIAIQVWSVSRWATQPRLQLILALERCWQLYSYRSKG